VVTDTGSCIAVSYEARACGIRTGTLIRDARRCCPGLNVVASRPPLYLEYHHRIVEAVESCLHVHAVHSIDEVSCRLLRNERDRATVRAAALRIKSVIRERIGEWVRCSIGVGPNEFLAKVGSKMEKPDGLVIIESHELPDRLYDLALQDLPGIARQMHERLRRAGVTSLRQLCALDARQMAGVWGGIVGERFWHALHGRPTLDLPIHRRTVGHSHVLPPELRNRDGGCAVLHRLIHKAAARMRRLGYSACKMAISATLLGGGRWSAWTRLNTCRDTLSILEGFARLWPQCPAGDPLQVGVVLFDLVPDSFTPLPLFPEEGKRIRLSQAMDQINAVIGRPVVYFGGMFSVVGSAPMRIAFTQIPDAEFVG
jgi:DNA polymerase-4